MIKISNEANSNDLMKEKKSPIYEISYVYILRCFDGSYYTGYTNNPEKRLKQHNSKKASKYTRSRTPVYFVMIKALPEKGMALSFEHKVKKLSRQEKEQLIAGNIKDFWKTINDFQKS